MKSGHITRTQSVLVSITRSLWLLVSDQKRRAFLISARSLRFLVTSRNGFAVSINFTLSAHEDSVGPPVPRLEVSSSLRGAIGVASSLRETIRTDKPVRRRRIVRRIRSNRQPRVYFTLGQHKLSIPVAKPLSDLLTVRIVDLQPSLEGFVHLDIVYPPVFVSQYVPESDGRNEVFIVSSSMTASRPRTRIASLDVSPSKSKSCVAMC